MNAFRVRHLENFLQLYRPSVPTARPLDKALRSYFSAHASRMDSADRQWLTLHTREILRWYPLLEATTIGKKDWSHKIATYFNKQGMWKKAANDGKLTAHTRLAVPDVLYAKLVAEYGEKKTEKICQILNENCGKVFLRVNKLQVTRDALYKKFLAHKVAVEKSPYTETGLMITGAVKLKDFPEFTAGLCEIQDDSSQFKAAQIKANPGQIVFDACAGNGGHALVYAGNMENLGHVFMRDVSYDNPRTKAAVKKRMKSAGIKNFTLIPAAQADLMEDKKKLDLTRLQNKCDWVLLDAPSTGSAVYRKHPELKAAFTEEKLRQCVERQREMFKEALPFVKNRGKIVYATSSIFSDENTTQVEFFCQAYNLEVVEEPLFILPQSNGMNGLFVAVLQKKSP